MIVLGNDVDPVRKRLVRVSREHVACLEPFKRVHAHKHRQVGELLHEIGVVELLLHHHLRHAERERRICSGADNDNLVALRRGRGVFDRNCDGLGSLQARLGEPVRIGHLGRNPVHAPNQDDLGVLHVEELEVVGLVACHHRVARRQVGVESVGIPGA